MGFGHALAGAIIIGTIGFVLLNGFGVAVVELLEEQITFDRIAGHRHDGSTSRELSNYTFINGTWVDVFDSVTLRQNRTPSALRPTLVMASIQVRVEGGETGDLEVRIATRGQSLSDLATIKAVDRTGQGTSLQVETLNFYKVLTFWVPPNNTYEIRNQTIAGVPEFFVVEWHELRL